MGVGSTFQFDFLLESMEQGEECAAGTSSLSIPDFNMDKIQMPDLNLISGVRSRQSELNLFRKPSVNLSQFLMAGKKSSFEDIIKQRIYFFADHMKSVLETGRNRILVVDDEATCLMGVRSLLKGAKIDVDTLVDVAMNGLEAVRSVETALELEVDYKFIFMDISMPVMDGLEATKQIRDLYSRQEDCRRGPVMIGVTGHAHEDFVKKAFEAGIDAVQPKPLNLEDLEKILKQNK